MVEAKSEIPTGMPGGRNWQAREFLLSRRTFVRTAVTGMGLLMVTLC